MPPIRPRQNIARVSRLSDTMVIIPNYLKPMQRSHYPVDNIVTFERWYMDNFTVVNRSKRIYLPIQWTALYCNNNYGSNKTIIRQIQGFLSTLDRTKKYYTIVQYDDGILNDLTGLDIKVMAMSKQSDFSLPLLCTKHPYKFNSPKRDIFASFVGSLTHPIRKAMYKQLGDREGYYVSIAPHDMKEYCNILARSKYALCPRGYGLSSFRIQEAIDYGAIPVYISDEFIVPYNMPTFVFGHMIQASESDFDFFDIGEALTALDSSVNENLFLSIAEKNKPMFTYAGCKREVLHYLNREDE